MKTPEPEKFYTFRLPPQKAVAPTLKDCDRWVAGLLDGLGTQDDLWIFAYGSLIWHTDFPVRERAMAHAYGYHRSFCVYSFHYRGTRDRPGLVLGLDRGGSCRGVALRVARADAEPVANYLWRREMISHAYAPRTLTVRCANRRVVAHCFVADPGHEQYAGGLSLDETARLIRQGVGSKGSNPDYLAATVRQLDGLGIADRPLRRLMKLVG